MTELTTHLGFFPRVVFVLLKLLRWTQNKISRSYWFVIAKPLLWAGWKIWGRTNDADGVRHLTFYQTNSIANFYGKTLKNILNINAMLNGLKHPFNSYQFLISWNPAVPLIALKNIKTTYSISLLGPENPDRQGWHSVLDGFVLGTSHVAGHFIITDKKWDNRTPKRVYIECLWLSGDRKGQKFVLDYLGSNITLNANSPQETPASIYFPPSIIVWCFEAILSLSAVAFLIGLIWQAWKYFYGHLSLMGFE